MRKAAVDVGTNSTRLLIADNGPETSLRHVTRITTVTALGRELAADGSLAEPAIERTLSVLRDYRELVRRVGVEREVAATTSAVRNAPNGPAYVSAVERETGFRLRILSGEEEGRLTFAGATSDQDSNAVCLVIDIGGGSTEFSVGMPGSLPQVVSLDIGCVRIQEGILGFHPPTPEGMAAAAAHVRGAVTKAGIRKHVGSPSVSIGVAGTPTSLAAVAQGLEPYDPLKVHGFELTAEIVKPILARLAKQSLDELRNVPGLHADRAPTILAGTLVLDAIMDYLELPKLLVSERDILDGLILEL